MIKRILSIALVLLMAVSLAACDRGIVRDTREAIESMLPDMTPAPVETTDPTATLPPVETPPDGTDLPDVFADPEA